jgi:hypothetical protein
MKVTDESRTLHVDASLFGRRPSRARVRRMDLLVPGADQVSNEASQVKVERDGSFSRSPRCSSASCAIPSHELASLRNARRSVSLFAFAARRTRRSALLWADRIAMACPHATRLLLSELPATVDGRHTTARPPVPPVSSRDFRDRSPWGLCGSDGSKAKKARRSGSRESAARMAWKSARPCGSYTTISPSMIADQHRS